MQIVLTAEEAKDILCDNVAKSRSCKVVHMTIKVHMAVDDKTEVTYLFTCEDPKDMA